MTISARCDCPDCPSTAPAELESDPDGWLLVYVPGTDGNVVHFCSWECLHLAAGQACFDGAAGDFLKAFPALTVVAQTAPTP